MTEPRELRYRRPLETDYTSVIANVDHWWGGRKMRALLPRLWFQHFTGTSWIAEDEGAKLVGFLVGFHSPDDPDVGYIHMVGTDPNVRRSGVARALYDRFFEDARRLGVRRIRAVTWPGNRVSVGFHTALGFRPDDGPGTQRLYGTPAYPDYDGEGEDRVWFSRDL